MSGPKLAALLLALGSFRECGGERPLDPVILSLGRFEVRRSEFDQHVGALEKRGGDLANDVREAVLQPFLEERVLLLEARTRGLVSSAATPEEEQAAVQRLVADAVHGKVAVADEDIDAYYREHPDEFRQAERILLRQILVPTENEARDLRRRLQKDPKSFEFLAQSRSRSPEASAGGAMGTFEPGQLPPELDTAAFSLPAGATSDIVVTAYGYHVLRVDMRTPAQELPLDQCRQQIRAKLSQERSARARELFVRELLGRAKVNHEAALRPHVG